MIEAIRSSETSLATRVTQSNIPEDGILHSHRREDIKSYIICNIHVRSTARNREPLQSENSLGTLAKVIAELHSFPQSTHYNAWTCSDRVRQKPHFRRCQFDWQRFKTLFAPLVGARKGREENYLRDILMSRYIRRSTPATLEAICCQAFSGNVLDRTRGYRIFVQGLTSYMN
jgi:hypothetical protein